MKNKQYTIIDKSDQMMCWLCEGKGSINTPTTICKTCNGYGIFREGHFIIVDEKNKIAIDTDSGG